MDAIDTILRAHDILDSLCGADGECTIGLDLKPINDIVIKLQRLTEHPERLIRITQQYDMKTAHDLRLMDEYYFIHKDEKPIIIYNIDGERTEVVFFPFPESERGYLSDEYLKRLQQEAFLICDFLTVISRALKGLYSKSKQSDRRRNRPIKITPFTDLLAADSNEVKPFSEYLSEHGRKHENEITRLLTPILNGAKGTLCTTCLNLLIWYGYMDNYSDDKGRPKLRALVSTLNKEFGTQLSKTSLRDIIRKGDIIVTKRKKSASQDVIDKVRKANYESLDISQLLIYLTQNALPDWKQSPRPISI